MSTIPDFNDSELWTVQSTLKERYGRDIEAQLAECVVTLLQVRVDYVAKRRAKGKNIQR